MGDLETSLQEFGEFLLRARLVKERAAPHCVRWVRRFLERATTDEPLSDRTRRFLEDLERTGRCQDWQIRQAEEALQIYFGRFLRRPDERGAPGTAVIDANGRTEPLAALQELRRTLRTRHYAHRTERSYVDWTRRFLDYVAERQDDAHPRVGADEVRDYLTHLAMHRRVSASTQNQALSAILLFCREVLGAEVGDVSVSVRARRGRRLPVVLSVAETATLLGAMKGVSWLMAALIYGGGLRVTECCQLRVKDVDFDQGLLLVHGKGNKQRSTLLAEVGRKELEAQLELARERHRADRDAGVAGVWLPDGLSRKYPNAATEWAWFWVFPSRHLSTDPRAGVVRRHHLRQLGALSFQMPPG